jgi:hypothetical protein
MASLEEIDQSRIVEFRACQYKDDNCIMLIGVEELPSIIINGADVALLLNLMMRDYWRNQWEEDLQSISMNENNEPLLTSWMPLVTFRSMFCHAYPVDEGLSMLLLQLRKKVNNWRDKGCEIVEFNGIKINC